MNNIAHSHRDIFRRPSDAFQEVATGKKLFIKSSPIVSSA